MSQNTQLALAYLNQVSDKMLGDPLSLGVKMITEAILGERPANYSDVKSPVSFRLAVICCFAYLAAMFTEKKTIDVLVEVYTGII